MQDVKVKALQMKLSTVIIKIGFYRTVMIKIFFASVV